MLYGFQVWTLLERRSIHMERIKVWLGVSQVLQFFSLSVVCEQYLAIQYICHYMIAILYMMGVSAENLRPSNMSKVRANRAIGNIKETILFMKTNENVLALFSSPKPLTIKGVSRMKGTTGLRPGRAS